ncbi:MAG: two-component system response regulator, partial [Thermomicrobiales bacterium]
YAPGAGPARLSQQAMTMLMEYDWPGNVRELENLIERATVLARGSVITEEHIDFFGTDSRRLMDVGERVRRGDSLAEILADVERIALRESLAQTDGDRAGAASLLDLPVSDFNDRARSYDL